MSNRVYDNTTSGFSLSQNFPNPFSGTSSFSYTTPKETEVKLSVRDMTGKQVKILIEGRVSEGLHQVNFDAGNLPSGSYLLILESGSTQLTKEMILAK